MKSGPDAAGTAALAICEALLLSLTERGLLTQEDVKGILEDAATAHRTIAPVSDNPKLHSATADLIERLIAGGSPVNDFSDND